MIFSATPITSECLARIEAYHRGELHKPQWLLEWEQRIEYAQQSLIQGLSLGTINPVHTEQYLQAVAKMMVRRNRLYNVWISGDPFKTWEDLANERLPSKDDLFRYTVEDTEDYLNGPNVSAFVLFLDRRWNGFLKEFTYTCLRECDPLLEEVITLTPEIRQRFAYPKESFRTEHPEILETRLLAWIRKIMPNNAPEYAHRLFIANTMAALGNYTGACSQAEFARCEAIALDFAQLMKQKDPRVDTYLKQSQRWLIDVLLKLWPS